jgi:hypothetical protein
MQRTAGEASFSLVSAAGCWLLGSDVGAGLGMPLQIPAGHKSSMREQRVDAGLRLRRVENELGLAILLQHRIIAGNCNLSERLAVRGHPIAEDGVINRIGNQRQPCGTRHSNEDQSLQETLDSGSQRGTHGQQLYPQLTRLRLRVLLPSLTTPRFHRQTTASSIAGFWRAPSGHSRRQVRV